MRLNYEKIKQAIGGCCKSQEYILEYYDEYINALSSFDHNVPGGENKKPDADLKSHIQCKLITAIKKWEERI